MDIAIGRARTGRDIESEGQQGGGIRERREVLERRPARHTAVGALAGRDGSGIVAELPVVVPVRGSEEVGQFRLRRVRAVVEWREAAPPAPPASGGGVP